MTHERAVNVLVAGVWALVFLALMGSVLLVAIVVKITVEVYG